jgi:GAF domain-containing protein
MVDHARLTTLLVEFANTLVSDYQATDILDKLCGAVAEVLPATGAGVMLADHQNQLRFVAASDETVRAIEKLQIDLDEGPCLHSFVTGEPVVIADLEHTDRFPKFSPRALEVGLRAVYSFPMAHGEHCIGALNAYGAQPAPFEEQDRVAGQVLADVATSYLLNARQFEESSRLTSQLEHALVSRIAIEQAKGRLAERHGTTPQEAFERLRRYARSRGARLHEVAREVAEGRLSLGDV